MRHLTIATANAAPTATRITMVPTSGIIAPAFLASSASKNHLFQRLMPTLTARLAKMRTSAPAVQNQAPEASVAVQKRSDRFRNRLADEKRPPSAAAEVSVIVGAPRFEMNPLSGLRGFS